MSGLGGCHVPRRRAVLSAVQTCERPAQRTLDHELLEGMPDGVMLVGADGLIIYANRRAEKITGYTRHELRGHPIELLVPQRLRANHREHRREYGARPSPRSMGAAEHDVRVRRKDGSEFSADIALGPSASTCGPEVVAVIRDITERRKFEVMLEHRALHDPLTDLANRTLFFDRLSQAILSGRRDRSQVALVMLDLDKFKLINDAHGHAVGDAVLKEFAARLAAGLRRTDTAARLGGDEFAWILPRIADRTAAELMVRKLLHPLNGSISVAGERIDVAVSAGVAVYPDDGDDVDTLMRQADRALYSAKRDGRGFASARLAS
jgi:diguanylate cyclase (GGDEF)-like protein/PAS domain S-box-containing protein